MARKLGARSPWEGLYKSRGGFNLGLDGPPPVQSSVATPNPAAAGVSGQPAARGGMRVGLPMDGRDDRDLQSVMTTAVPASNANVTGFDPGLVGNAITFGTLGMPSPTAGLGPIVGPIVNSLGRMGINMGLNAFPSNLTTAAPMTSDQGIPIPTDSPVTYSGKAPGLLGTLGNMFGIPTGFLTANVPDPTGVAGPQGLSVNVPDASPVTGQTGEASGGDPSGGQTGGLGGFGVGLGGSPGGVSGDGSESGSGDDGSDASTGIGIGSTGGAISDGVSGVGIGIGEGAPGISGDAGLSDAGVTGADASGNVSGQPAGVGFGDAPSDPSGQTSFGLGIGLSGLGEAAGMGSSAGIGDGGIGGGIGDGIGDAGAGGGAVGGIGGPDSGIGDSGDGGAGGGAGGGGASLLCNYAIDSGRCGDESTAKKVRRDLDMIVQRAFRDQPGMKESFKHYQDISGKIIAKMKALPAEAEEAAFADLQNELVGPVTKAARRGDAVTVGRALRRMTVKLAKQYGVAIPEAYLAASEKVVGPRADDDKSYNKPSGKLQKPEPKRLAGMLEPDDEAPVQAAPSKPKSAGPGGMSVGRSIS